VEKAIYMKRTYRHSFLLFMLGLMSLFIASCGPAVLAETPTPVQTATAYELLATPTIVPPFLDTPTRVCDGLCPDVASTATAIMALTFAAIPTSTPPPWATIIPATGDLGWGSIHGTITDGATSLPLEGVTVTCEHVSATSPYLCNGVTTTNSDGIYVFMPVFFNEADRITLTVEAPGYTSLRFELGDALIPPADFRTDLGLFPLPDGPTPTPPPIMCTPPSCSDGALVCGDPNGCVGGCGTVCMPFTPTP
jgi:hypothetical protein